MSVFKEIEGLIANQVLVIKACLSTTKLEAKLAGLSVFPLLVNVCLLLVGVMSTWLTAQAFIGYTLMQTFDSITVAFVGTFALNLLAVVLLLFYLRFNLKKMSFEKTRAYLASYTQVRRVPKDLQNECQEKNNARDSSARTDPNHSSMPTQ